MSEQLVEQGWETVLSQQLEELPRLAQQALQSSGRTFDLAEQAEITSAIAALTRAFARRPESGETLSIPEPRKVRATLRAKGQVTVPREVRDLLHVSQGDDIEFRVLEDGAVSITGLKIIPADQAWFWTEEWQRGEQEASEQIARGETTTYGSTDDFLNSLR